MLNINLNFPEKKTDYTSLVNKANTKIILKLKELKKHLHTLKSSILIKEIDFLELLINSAESSLNFFTSQISLFESVGIMPSEILETEIKFTNGLKTIVTISKDNFIKKPRDKFKYVKFNKIIFSIMDYTQYTEVYYNILQRNEINICVYCQAQNALYYYSKPEKGNDKNLRWYFNLTLDHILSKSEFPFLAVNINNLAPVCSHCNSRKGKKQTHYNPYIDTFNYRFHFDDIEFELNPLKFNLEKMKLKKIDSTKNEKLNDILDLEGLYKHQSFIAESLIDRFAKFNSKGYYKNVNGVISSITEEDVKYFISDCNMSEDNLLKYPLVRFKIDLYNYLINKHKKKR